MTKNLVFLITAALFAAACQIAGVVAERDEKAEEALASYGRYLGIAFQRNSHEPRARRLRLGGNDRDLLANQLVHSCGFAGSRRADPGNDSAAGRGGRGGCLSHGSIVSVRPDIVEGLFRRGGQRLARLCRR